MAVGIVPARQAAPPPERPLWRLVRGERVADALVRAFPHGDELVITVSEHNQPVAANVLDREFAAARPNQR